MQEENNSQNPQGCGENDNLLDQEREGDQERARIEACPVCGSEVKTDISWRADPHYYSVDDLPYFERGIPYQLRRIECTCCGWNTELRHYVVAL